MTRHGGEKTSRPRTLVIDGLEVEVLRKRVRNINLRVREDGSVHVSAPARVAQARIEEFVRAKRPWIDKVRGRVDQQTERHGVRCIGGATVYLWGEPLVIRISTSADLGRSRCKFEQHDNRLDVYARPSLADEGEASVAARTKALNQWLRDQLEQQIVQLLPHCQAVVGKSCSSIRIRAMSSRWGSCNVKTGTITLSTRLVHHEPACLEYVLYHELCHLHEPSHNAHFHALMDRFYPAWPKVRAQLNGR